MATVKIDTFGGISPRIHPTLLPDGMAIKAHNCSLETGKLRPIRQPKKVTNVVTYLENGLGNPSEAKSMHVWRHGKGSGFDFILFPGMTWSASGNVADDDLTRLVVSGDTGAKFTDKGGKVWDNTPLVYMRSGEAKVKKAIPIAKIPLDAPVVTRTKNQGELADNRRYTRFFVSWVDKHDMESPISAPSLTRTTVIEKDESGAETEIVKELDDDLEYNDGDNISIEVKGWSEIKDEAKAVRIYKVITGSEEGRIQFIREVVASLLEGDPVISVRVKDENAGEIMPEIEAPPADLRCICDVPGGFYCGTSPSKPKTVFFSDVDLLYSWPTAYRYDVKDNIVALAVTSNTVFALTDGRPYVLTGTLPEAMTVAKIAESAACLSPRGVCVHQNSVYFASNAGVMMIGNSANEGTVCVNITEGAYTKEQWQEFNPSSCVMGKDRGALLLFFTLLDGKHKSIRIGLSEDSKIAISTHDEAAACLAIDEATGKVYYVREGV